MSAPSPDPTSDRGLRDAKSQVKSGVVWLGTANLAAQVLDALSLVVVLLYLTREDVGVATISWSLAVIVESLNGLGVGTSLIQAPKLDREVLDSAFWYAFLTGLLFCGLTSAAAPLVASYYGDARLAPMVMVSAAKLPLVSAALVPLSQLNRRLAFRDLAIIQTTSSLLSVLVKIGLAVAGFGAWALVISHSIYGLFTLVGAYARSGYRPRFRFSKDGVLPHVRFGLKVCPQGILYQTLRNADFLIIGRVLGSSVLGVYRVAFDVAMTPPLAIHQTVSRTAMPVFARLLEKPAALAGTFVWMQRGLVLATLPIVVFLTFGAQDLLALVGHGRWVAAAPLLIVLSWAAIPRVLSQLYPELHKALGRPGLATWTMLVTFCVLVAGFLIGLALAGTKHGAMPIALVWVVAYPPIVFGLHRITSRMVPIALRDYVVAFRHPLFAAMLASVPAALLSIGRGYLPDDAALSLAFCLILASSILGVFWQYGSRVLGLSLKQLLGGKLANV